MYVGAQIPDRPRATRMQISHIQKRSAVVIDKKSSHVSMATLGTRTASSIVSVSEMYVCVYTYSYACVCV